MWNRVFVVSIFLLSFTPSDAQESEIGARLLYQQQQPSAIGFSVPYPLSPTPHKLSTQDIYLHLQQRSWTFRGQISATQQSNGGYTDTKGTIHEWYLDFSINEIEASIGKKVASWGVGYGFRPLDVIQRETRQALRTFDLEGVPMLMLEYFSADSAITAVVTNRLSFNASTPHRGAYEAAIKYSTLLGNSDLHLLLYQQQGEGFSVGAGSSTTSGNHLELHGSLRYLLGYHKQIHQLHRQPPVLLNTRNVFNRRSQHHGIQALLGASWTGENGYTLMLEAWHDSTAYSSKEWSDLLRINRGQRNQLLTGAPRQMVYRNIMANSLIYKNQNILKNTLFMRLLYDGEKTDPNLSLLYTPADGGAVLTASADYAWNDQVSLLGSARLMGGRNNSAYRQSSTRWQLFIGMQLFGNIL